MDHKVADCPKKGWRQQDNTPGSGMGTNSAPRRGRPPMNTTLGSNRGGKRPQAGGRVFSLEGEEAEDPTVTILGTLLIKHLYAHVLF